ncbi:MAG: sporulation protein YpjB [Ectobacillus sp.]
MKKVIVVIIWALLSLMPLQIYAAPAQRDSLNQLLDESLQLVKQEEYEKAKKILTYFSEDYVAKGVLPEHTRVVSLAYNKAVQAMGDGTSQREKEADMLALRLAVDAESSKYQPLWLSRQGAVMTAFYKMEQAIKQEEGTKFQHALNEFLYEFDIIYPSLAIDLSKEELRRINAHLSYLEEYRTTMAKHANGQMQMKVIRKDMEDVFRYPNKDEADPSLIWVMITTGGIIVFTLSYVGWRKYRGEQEKHKKRMQSKGR